MLRTNERNSNYNCCRRIRFFSFFLFFNFMLGKFFNYSDPVCLYLSVAFCGSASNTLSLFSLATMAFIVSRKLVSQCTHLTRFSLYIHTNTDARARTTQKGKRNWRRSTQYEHTNCTRVAFLFHLHTYKIIKSQTTNSSIKMICPLRNGKYSDH